MTKPIIAVDIDEVLSASASDFVAFSNERWGTNLKVEDYTEHWAEMWQVDIEEVMKRRDAYIGSGIALRHQPIIDAKHALEKLKEEYDIILVTSRSLSLESETRAWLEEHYAGIAKEIYFTGIYDANLHLQSHVQTKSDIFNLLRPVVVIDDQAKHCEAAADLGIEAILFGNYAWNKDFEPRKYITRCHDWAAVLTYFRTARL